MVLLTGAQLHSMFWPSIYSSMLTTTSILRLGFTLVIVSGGVLELRHLVQERAALLAQEREHTQRLEELAMLKDDFTAIVAHELASPVSAIDALANVAAIEELPAPQRTDAATAIQAEVRVLRTLVADVRAVADIEREEFEVNLRPVSVGMLLKNADTYARTLPDDHPVSIDDIEDAEVLADPDRIGQVLRNILNNAVRHTPAGTPVTLRACCEYSHVRIEVSDRGPGITPADQVRIFEKFGRGLDSERRAVPGRGLGLYLSRRIVELHGSELILHSTPGEGAAFSFQLERTT